MSEPDISEPLPAELKDPIAFSRSGPRPLRNYQQECVRAISASIKARRGRTFSVMFARQMGKNETSAQLEAFLLARHAETGGSIVKAAPSFKPQIITSLLRLKEVLNASEHTRDLWTPAFGHMIRLGNASISFFSADKKANVVGATASLLLEIDEAQDVDPDKYDREFRPMASAANATTVLYGTAWSDDSLLERQRRHNLVHEARTGEKLHFEYDWTELAKSNSAYKAFVEGEIARLGEDHPTVQTQYLLHCLSDAGRLFSVEQRAALRGWHRRVQSPEADRAYVAGIDVAGEDEQPDDGLSRLLAPRKDSTVITIAEIHRASDGQPIARVVDHLWWTGRDQVWQYGAISRLWERWRFTRVVVDASGIGAGLADFLAARYPDRLEKFTFSQPSKSKLGYAMLAMINTGRLSVYAEDGSAEIRELWYEIERTRYSLAANEIITWHVPESEGHDDFVVSLALAARAAEMTAPPPISGLIRAPKDMEDTW